MSKDDIAELAALADTPNAKEFPILLTVADTKDKTYIVTGANQGLGLEAARHLVSLGASKVILTARNLQSGTEAVKDIETTTGITGVAEVWPLDLTKYDTGRETNVTVNTFSTILLAILLLLKLKETGQKFGTLPVLVNVATSYSFLNEKDLKQLRESGLKGLNVEADAVMEDRYAVSKLVTMYAIYHIADQLGSCSDTDVVVDICCPGAVKTKFIRKRLPEIQASLNSFYAQYGRDVEPASRAYLHALGAGRVAHGKFVKNRKIKQQVDTLPSWIVDAEGKKLGKQLWDEIVVELEKIVPGSVAKAL